MIKYLQSGPLVVVMAFILWGLTPLFYKYLSGGVLTHILIYRVIFPIPLLLGIRLLFNRRTLFRDLLKDKRSFVFCMIAGLLMIISWSSFIYALTNHQVLDASLGYFINPLFVILLGYIFLKEKLSLFQMIAVFFRYVWTAISVVFGTQPSHTGTNHGAFICIIRTDKKIHSLWCYNLSHAWNILVITCFTYPFYIYRPGCNHALWDPMYSVHYDCTSHCYPVGAVCCCTESYITYRNRPCPIYR